MKTLDDQLTTYASYHRDRRNILTHVVGIPVIVLSISTLLAQPYLTWLDLGPVGAGHLTPAWLAALALGLYYLRLDLRYGLVMALWLSASNMLGAHLAQGEGLGWLAWGVGLFTVGWAVQFLGHYFEGRKPAFVDDIMGLAIGPLFVAAELGFMLGLRPEVEEAVIARAGEVR